jgi:hypothetical protein
MAEKFDYLLCPMCGSILVYSEGTHDLGCVNNPKPNDNGCSKNEKCLHEEAATYESVNSPKSSSASECMNMDSNGSLDLSGHKPCDSIKYGSENSNNNICEMHNASQDSPLSENNKRNTDLCFFGMSFTESAYKGTLWSIRIVDEKTNYSSLMRLMQDAEKRFRAKEPLAANVPNLPKKIERNKVTKLAFRYNLEIEDLYSIKYSTETIERLAMFYNLTQKEVRHIKQTDIMED